MKTYKTICLILFLATIFALTKAVENAGDTISDKIKHGKDYIADKIDVAASKVKGMFGSGDVQNTDIIGDLKESLTIPKEGISPETESYYERYNNRLEKVGTPFEEVTLNVKQKAGETVEETKGYFQSGYEGVKQKVEDIVEGGKDMINRGKERVQSAAEGVKSTAEDVMSRGKEKAGNLKEGIREGYENVKDTIGEKVTGGKEKIEDVIQSGKETIQGGKEKVEDLYESGKEKVKDYANLGRRKFEVGAEQLEDLYNIGWHKLELFFKSGKMNLEDFRDLFGDKLGEFWDFLSDKGDEAKDKAKDTLAQTKKGIERSPDRVRDLYNSIWDHIDDIFRKGTLSFDELKNIVGEKFDIKPDKEKSGLSPEEFEREMNRLKKEIELIREKMLGHSEESTTFWENLKRTFHDWKHRASEKWGRVKDKVTIKKDSEDRDTSKSTEL